MRATTCCGYTAVHTASLEQSNILRVLAWRQVDCGAGGSLLRQCVSDAMHVVHGAQALGFYETWTGGVVVVWGMPV